MFTTDSELISTVHANSHHTANSIHAASIPPQRTWRRQVTLFMMNAQYGDALQVLEGLVNDALEQLGDVVNTKECYSFSSPLEEELYQSYYQPVKDYVVTDLPIDIYYRSMAGCYEGLGRQEDAIKAYQSAMRYNPVSIETLFAYMDSLYNAGEWSRYCRLCRRAFGLAYTPRLFAATLRRTARYYQATGQSEAAQMCYYLSLAWGPDSKDAATNLQQLDEQRGEPIANLTIEHAERVATQYGFWSGPDNDLVGLMARCGRSFFAREEWEQARYYLELEAALSGDPETQSLLMRIPGGEP